LLVDFPVEAVLLNFLDNVVIPYSGFTELPYVDPKIHQAIFLPEQIQL